MLRAEHASRSKRPDVSTIWIGCSVPGFPLGIDPESNQLHQRFSFVIKLKYNLTHILCSINETFDNWLQKYKYFSNVLSLSLLYSTKYPTQSNILKFQRKQLTTPPYSSRANIVALTRIEKSVEISPALDWNRILKRKANTLCRRDKLINNQSGNSESGTLIKERDIVMKARLFLINLCIQLLCIFPV